MLNNNNIKSIAKKYRSFNDDYKKFVKALTENPNLGIDPGNGYRKIKMARWGISIY